MSGFVMRNNFLKKKIDRVILHFLQIPTIIIDIKNNPKNDVRFTDIAEATIINHYKRRRAK